MMMNHIRTKIDLVRKLLDEMENEYHFTEILTSLSSNHQIDFEKCLPEKVYFNLIKHIVEQDDLPKNIDGINVYMDNNDQITRYEFISFFAENITPKNYVNIVWEN